MGKASGRYAEHDDCCCGGAAKSLNQKKVWQPTVHEVKKANPSLSLQGICRLLGYSTQAYHKGNQRAIHRDVDEAVVLKQVAKLRKHQLRCGGRKLFLMLQPFFKEYEIVLGRDKFFALLKRGGLLVRKKKRGVYTTQSKHFLYRYPNLVKNMVLLKAHELWVADITYLPLANRFAYLFLITDAYSRKIVGFHLSEDMKVSSAMVALQKALSQKPLGALVIHHSDRGLQYCSAEYVQLLKKHHVQISMTENADPYENAIAERVNGILKDELLRSRYADITCASAHVTRCIAIYNDSRRHSSLNWQVPGEAHSQTGPQIRQWKNYYQKPKCADVSAPET